MKTLAKEALKDKLLADDAWKEAFRSIGGPDQVLLDYLVPENRTARAILTNDVHSGEAANAIFAETFKVFSVIWGKDVDHNDVKKLLGIYKDCLHTTGTVEIREHGEDSLKQGLGRIEYFQRELLNLAKQSHGWKKVRCLRLYMELKACCRMLEVRDASVAEKFIQLVLDSWEDVRSLPVFLGVATSLTELFPVSDVSDNLIASLIGLRIAERSWPRFVPSAYAPENLKSYC